jgi:hypothetical protein
MPLSKLQLTDQCLAFENTADKCRYCAQDDDDWSKYHCLKKTSRKTTIDIEVEEFIREVRKKGGDPYKDNLPLGDNCAGYPIMKHIEQCYDVK